MKVIMEGDEMEMSKGELQKWIREKVKKNGQISRDVLAKSNLLQSLLERREKQAAHLLKLCKSVAACEEIVKKQYSLLGWEYRDTDSDDDDKQTGSGNTPPSPRETQVPRPPTTTGPTPMLAKLEDSENLIGDNGKNNSICRKGKPVVVLTRLTTCMINSLCQRTPQNHYSEDESFSNLDSGEQWEPEDDSHDSDYATSIYKTGSNKKRKIDQNHYSEDESLSNPDSDKQWEPEDDSNDSDYATSSYETGSKKKTKMDGKEKKNNHATPQAGTNTDAKSNAAKTSAPQANMNNDAKRNVECNAVKTSTPPANTNGVTPVHVSALRQPSDTKTPPSVPGEIKVNMNVLARKRALSWKRGKVMEIVTKEDGRLKYKVHFQEKGKSLVSAHHIALDCMPKAEQLFVGARVVIKCQADQSQFCPGVLAELPSRKNRMRFLVFIDDHRPVYVGLPLLYLVFRPLTDPLDDIPDDDHKNFMKEYIEAWPYPPQTQYMVGQTINAEHNGAQQRCEVQVVDCSLIEVVFQIDQHKEWIYRGSMRLEHMINMRGHLELDKGGAAVEKTFHSR